MDNTKVVESPQQENARMKAAILAVLERPFVVQQLRYIDANLCTKHLPVETQDSIKYNSSVWLALRNSINT